MPFKQTTFPLLLDHTPSGLKYPAVAMAITAHCTTCQCWCSLLCWIFADADAAVGWLLLRTSYWDFAIATAVSLTVSVVGWLMLIDLLSSTALHHNVCLHYDFMFFLQLQVCKSDSITQLCCAMVLAKLTLPLWCWQLIVVINIFSFQCWCRLHCSFIISLATLAQILLSPLAAVHC